MKGEITVFKECGKSSREIATIVNEPYSVANNILVTKFYYETSKSPGKSNKLPVHQTRMTLRILILPRQDVFGIFRKKKRHSSL